MLTLCIALHLYHGPVDSPGVHVDVLREDCFLVTRNDVRNAVKACARLGTMRCEAVANGPGELIIENKWEAK